MSRELQPCGTPAAYQRHRRRQEDACAACIRAWAAYTAQYKATHLLQVRRTNAAAKQRRRRGESPVFQPCGTRAGYARHRYYGQTACFACRVAAAAYEAQRRQACDG